MQRRRLTNVRFLPYQPKSELSTSISAADLHLVPLDPCVASCLMPSKLYGVLASGTAVLAVAPENCELAQIVRETQTGVVCPPASSQRLAETIIKCASDREALLAMGRRASSACPKSFTNRPQATNRFANVLAELMGLPRTQTKHASPTIEPVLPGGCTFSDYPFLSPNPREAVGVSTRG